MKTYRYRVAADLPEVARRLILSRHRPAFQGQHLHSITWSYGVAENFAFDGEQQVCTLYALHTGLNAQAFLADIGGLRLRPDGKLIHLTFSTAPGVAPVASGEIDPERVELISPISYPTRLQLRPLWAQPSRSTTARA